MNSIDRNWALLCDDVIRAVQQFFIDGIMPEGVNDTSIVLIPKKNDPEELKDFRRISVCNVIFKVVSKCLVNRLRPLLQDIICNNPAFRTKRRVDLGLVCIHAS
jgi:hypothetical protein